MRHQQEQENVLRNCKLPLVNEPFDEQMTAKNLNQTALQYTANESRLILKDELLYMQYYGETGKVKYLQVLLPENLVNSFTEAHHGIKDNHRGITNLIQQ